jgi:hypothetical protein
LRELFPGAEFDAVNSLLLEISQQTKDKSMYDAQEKQRRDLLWLQNIAIEEAEQRGKKRVEKRGEKRGTWKGKIMRLQEVLGLPLTPALELSACSTEQLESILEELRTRIKNRS